MARIRTIKPEFPQSETIGKLSRDARLLFIQLWTIADDSGKSRASSRMLASLLYPYDDDARGLIDGWLDDLETNNCIRRYEIDGSHYLEIVNWLKHQRIDHPGKSRLPEFRETLAKPRETLATDLGPRIGPKRSKKISCSNEFELFWKAYPKRVGKKVAEKALAKALRETSIETITEALTRQTPLWTEPKFIPDPATWLNAGRWTDDVGYVNGEPKRVYSPEEIEAGRAWYRRKQAGAAG